MGELMILLITLLVLIPQSYSQDRYSDLRIDCGSTTETPATDDRTVSWQTDENLATSGLNHPLIYSLNFSPMNTLRYFPDGQTNCYNLPFYDSYGKFLFRAGFYYGNYDGLWKPPSFNLTIDGNLWATVTTSLIEKKAIYHEMIYIPSRDSAEICLIRTSDEDVPFISSLEATELYGLHDMYRLMENQTALKLESRISYGGNLTIQKLISHPDDFNRIWNSEEMPQYLNIVDSRIVDDIMFGENNPPWPVMQTAIQAQNLSKSINLSVNFSTPTAVAYIVLYFRDPISRYPENNISQVEVYVDGQKLGGTDVPPYYRTTDLFHVVSLYPVQVYGSANLTVSPAKNSTLATVTNTF